jgi:1,4-alpha-glucan branching enzyme
MSTRHTQPHEPQHHASQAKPAATKPAGEQAQVGLGDWDLHLFNEGRHHRLYDKLGAHAVVLDGKPATYFAVWAPNAQDVSVIGDFNDWKPMAHPLKARARSGVFEGVLPNVGKGARYKYHVSSLHHGYQVDKTDPFGIYHELAPNTASIVWDLDYTWSDDAWMKTRKARSARDAPISIYELHIGSFRRVPEEKDRFLTYRELAPLLADHVTRLGFTHVELLPVMEHPFYGSWGYQVTGYFAPTSRYGTPQDFMFLIDTLHQRGIGVILDWVPAHFPTDEHGLGYFDGTHLFEHADRRQGFHPDWKSSIFNYGRREVQSFLTSSAIFWLDRYHADGLRVDGVASMLYLDYSRAPGEWIPNEHGGRENLEAVSLLRHINTSIYKEFPDVQTYAEESTSWPGVSRPPYTGGLGFGYKWDLGFANDTLHYMHEDPVYRRFHHGKLTFRPMYAFNENFVLPFSHDEVVHGKGSLYGKMPGDSWQRLANLRLMYAYLFAQPGKKLMFMGAELGQEREWSHDRSLDWHLLEQADRQGLSLLLGDLNRLYRELPSLHELDTEAAGFMWIDFRDADQSVIAFERRARGDTPPVIVVCNFTPVVRHNYRVGVATFGAYRELLNTDANNYGGSGQGNMGRLESTIIGSNQRPFSLNLTLPPLGALYLQYERPTLPVRDPELKSASESPHPHQEAAPTAE